MTTHSEPYVDQDDHTRGGIPPTVYVRQSDGSRRALAIRVLARASDSDLFADEFAWTLQLPDGRVAFWDEAEDHQLYVFNSLEELLPCLWTCPFSSGLRMLFTMGAIRLVDDVDKLHADLLDHPRVADS